MGVEVEVLSYTDFDKGHKYTSVPFSNTWEKSEGAKKLC